MTLCRAIALGYLITICLNADVISGQRAYDRADFAAAFQEWRASAEQGDPQAQEYMGWPITPRNAPRLTCTAVRLRFDSMERLEFKIELHNTRPFIEQMVLGQAENYTAGYQPKRPTVKVLVYRIEGGQPVRIPVHLSLAGGSSGPYGDEARRTHLRNHGVFDESLLVSVRIPIEEAERKIYNAQFLAEAEKLVAEGKGNPQLLDVARKQLDSGSPYLDSLFPNREGAYEIVVRYASQDPRFWPNQLASPGLRFEVVKTREWIDAFRSTKPRY
jgi:hypothetical protein